MIAQCAGRSWVCSWQRPLARGSSRNRPVPPSSPGSSGSIAPASGWERSGRSPTTAIWNSHPTALASPSRSPIVPARHATSGSTPSPRASGLNSPSDPADENWLIWSPDGARVLLNSFARDRLSLLEAQSSAAGERQWLLEGDEGKWPVSWSPDGRYVLYVTNNDRTSNDIWVLAAGWIGIALSLPPHRGIGELGGVLSRRQDGWSSVRPSPVSPKCSLRRGPRRCGAGACRRTAARKRDGVAMGRRSSMSHRTGC